MLRKLAKTGLVLGIGAGVMGCDTKAGTGAAVGAGGGALIGGIIGNQSKGRGTEGALIGAAAGAIGGALVGNAMDQEDRRRAERQHWERVRRERDREAQMDPRYAPPPIMTRDVVEWSRNGTPDDVIIDRIWRSGSVFYLTARDENELRDAGVREPVIRAMRDTARR